MQLLLYEVNGKIVVGFVFPVVMKWPQFFLKASIQIFKNLFDYKNLLVSVGSNIASITEISENTKSIIF